jgi:hypothetical protein|tara:strand:+ start:936 stop:1163 length:228 start_codon:yes stop_codon:yes gene_type:complete
MQKTYFHNSRYTRENKDERKPFEAQSIDKKRIVDINKLLNRVKADKKNEKKKQIIFFSLSTLGLILIASFITFIK